MAAQRKRAEPKNGLIVVYARIPEELWREIDLRATEGDRTFTAQLIRTLRKGLEAEAEK